MRRRIAYCAEMKRDDSAFDCYAASVRMLMGVVLSSKTEKHTSIRQISSAAKMDGGYDDAAD